jgi:hypothetical protein
MNQYLTRQPNLVKERVLNETPGHTDWLLRHIRFDDPLLCLSFLAEQRIEEPEVWKDLTRLMGWMVTTFDWLRRSGRTPDLPTSVTVESAAVYVIDYWLTLFVEARSDPDPSRVLLDARPPNLAAYLHTCDETKEMR